MTRRWFSLVVPLALPWALACATPSATGPSEAASAGGEGGEASGEATAEAQRADAHERGPLGALHAGDTLTYLVHDATGDHRAYYLVHEVVRRGDAVAVRLRPIGAPVGESLVIFGGWIVAGPEGVLALEPHVSLGEPGFVPIGVDGALVTEARGMVAWRVPPRWSNADARAFETDAVDGWRLADVHDAIEGPVRGEGCVRLERSDASITTAFVVCRNVGVLRMERRGEGDESDGSWRLVDLGAAAGELDDQPLGAGVEPSADRGATP